MRMLDVICYILLVLGLPLAVGGFAGMLLPIKAMQIDEVVDGIASMVVAIIMFRLFGTPLFWIAPVILTVVNAIQLSARNETKAILPQAIGLAVTYVIYSAIQ